LGESPPTRSANDIIKLSLEEESAGPHREMTAPTFQCCDNYKC
jgi:hypothetical protein